MLFVGLTADIEVVFFDSATIFMIGAAGVAMLAFYDQFYAYQDYRDFGRQNNDGKWVFDVPDSWWWYFRGKQESQAIKKNLEREGRFNNDLYVERAG